VAGECVERGSAGLKLVGELELTAVEGYED
jgi:hypothetical protein